MWWFWFRPSKRPEESTEKKTIDQIVCIGLAIASCLTCCSIDELRLATRSSSWRFVEFSPLTLLARSPDRVHCYAAFCVLFEKMFFLSFVVFFGFRVFDLLSAPIVYYFFFFFHIFRNAFQIFSFHRLHVCVQLGPD